MSCFYHGLGWVVLCTLPTIEFLLYEVDALPDIEPIIWEHWRITVNDIFLIIVIWFIMVHT